MSKFRKILAGFSALALAVALMPMFAAFEAHVINVTAKIENALSVPVKYLDYGTVFPQEYLLENIGISLSGSFIEEGRVDDVEYFIRQKPKCAITSSNGTEYDATVGPDGSHLYTGTGHISLGDNPATQEVETDFPVIDCGEAPRALVAGESWGVLPSLCEYLSKHKENDNQTQEVQVNAFHKAWTIGDGPDDDILNDDIIWTEAKGYLTKEGSDTEDNWVIDLAVPCFGDYCAQDWASFVGEHNPAEEVNAQDWTQPITNEHKVFGCDLWVEVSGVSEAEEVERPVVGADFTAYAAPTCDVTVDDDGGDFTTVQAAIDDVETTTGETVCVNPGTYDEVVNVNKEVTIAATGAVGSASVDAFIIDADNVTVKGLEVTGGNTEGTFAGFYIKSGVDTLTIRDNDIDGPSINDVITAGGSRGIVNVSGVPVSAILVENNTIHEWTSGIYTNPDTGVGVTWTIRLNDIDDNLAGIGELNSAVVNRNEFSNSGVAQEAIGAGPTYDAVSVVSENNFLAGTMLNTYGPLTGNVVAQNNFWNLGGAAQTGGTDEVDFAPVAGGIFPHN